jgi:cellulose synthase/poly-beta-1,6-N-acetylglucosamine synthase-like glycosyltransferase
MKENKPKYALMTAARNEQAFIEKVIRSVISQTILPVKWIIVNDGSKDRTQEIVTKYLKEHTFIELVTVSGDSTRNFGSKARALQYAYKKLSKIDFEYIGNLDADVAFDKDYYERLLEKFNAHSKLGIAGGKRYDRHNNKFKLVRNANNSVGGPFQFFARKCYEDIGGYMPMQHGGIDSVAEIKARKMGWKVDLLKI